MGCLYILVIPQYLFKNQCGFFLIFTCLHLDLWFSCVNSTKLVTTAALYIVDFNIKGIPAGNERADESCNKHPRL